MNLFKIGCIFLFVIISKNIQAQINETPLDQYNWKRNKTETAKGFVVLKSGKRLDGTIVLKGDKNKISEILFTEKGKEKTIEFPPAALKSYGLLQTNAVKATIAISDSPETMYEWRDMGIVMGKKISSTKPRLGYVILKNGKRIEGKLKLRKEDGVLTSFQVKGNSKWKGAPSQVSHYGYTVSEESVVQENLDKKGGKFYEGTVNTTAKTMQGEIAQKKVDLHFYAKTILFKDKKGKLIEFKPADIVSFTQTKKGETKKYVPYLDVFIEEEYKGATFKLIRNPYPTSTNNFLSGLVKESVAIGANATAAAIVNKDAKKNGYETKMDSVIANSSPERLVQLQNGLVKASGYSSVEELKDKSTNESLKKNISAIEIAIAGNEIRNTEGGIMNKEWIIINVKTDEKIIFHKGNYKESIEPLLKGCYEYLSLDKKEQRGYQKINNIETTLSMLDSCY